MIQQFLMVLAIVLLLVAAYLAAAEPTPPLSRRIGFIGLAMWATAQTLSLFKF